MGATYGQTDAEVLVIEGTVIADRRPVRMAQTLKFEQVGLLISNLYEKM